MSLFRTSSPFICLLLVTNLAQAQDQPQAPIRMAILPIVVHSADDPAFLREGLADMLTARLDQAGGFEIIHVDDLKLATTHVEDALEAGRGVDAQFVLFGSFTRFGTGASLDMQCASTKVHAEKPPLREIFVHSGSIGEVIPDLDNLVGKLSRFAIAGYSDSRGVVAAGGADGAGEGAPTVLDQEIEDLTLRIESLEASLEELASAVYEDDSSGGAAADSPAAGTGDDAGDSEQGRDGDGDEE